MAELSEPIVKDVIAAWRTVWDSYDLDPAHVDMPAKIEFWGKKLGKAGMTDDNAVGLNSAFLLWWTGDRAPKLGHLLSWLRNRPAEPPKRVAPVKQRKRTQEEEDARLEAGRTMFERMRKRLKGGT